MTPCGRAWGGAISRRLAGAVAPAAIALAFVVLVVLALLPASGTAAEGIEVEVTECGSASQPSGCSTGSQRVQRDAGQKQVVVPVKPKPAPAPAPAAPRPERHEVDLRSGADSVKRTDGSEERGAKVDVEVKPADDAGHEPSGKPRPDVEASAPVEPKTALDPVTTTAGSPFAGFGSGMDFVSTDEALARFAIPPFLVPIYVAAGRAYDVPWNLLAAINQIETDFGRIGRQVSTAGALGWMQFMPGTWKTYGVDASGDGVADPYNPVDAIYAAARYLRAGGAPGDLRRAVFAYNHADWYVDSVLKTASIYGSLPGGLVAETGSLAFGRFPVLGRVSYGDDFRRARAAGAPARGLTIDGRAGAAAVATQAVTVRRILLDERLAGAFRFRPLPGRGLSRRAGLAAPEPSANAVPLAALRVGPPATGRAPLGAGAPGTTVAPRGALPRGFARSDVPGIGVVVEDALGNRYRYGGLARVARGVRPGARLSGGKTVGRLSSDGRMVFSVRAAGGAAVDPRPLVDGYRLQEVADFQHAVAPLGDSPFVPDAEAPEVEGGVVRGSQRELARRVLDDPGIDIYPGGRQDIERGIIDKRILGALLYLRRGGLEVTVSCLRSGHSFYTAGGNVSAHSFGAAVDISAFNGQPVVGNQGPGSLTEQAIKLLMRLDGEARPAQLISLMSLGGPSFAMGDHDDHLHVGYHFEPSLGLGRSGGALGSVTFDGAASSLLRPGKVDSRHERALAGRLGKIHNPSVRHGASSAGVRVEGEEPAERDVAERLARRSSPLRAAPTAAGARMIDIDVPSGARGDEAYAIGTVDGAARGWAKDQVVVLARRDGGWTVVGPPRGADGHVANPPLRALATVPGGRGFAVGKDGSIVALRGARPPAVVDRASKADLEAVAVRREGARVAGVAVGAQGTAVDLVAARARALRAASRGDSLTAVTFAGSSAVAVGERASGGPLVLRRAGAGWRTLAAPADRAHVSLTAIAGGRDALWVAGGRRDGDGPQLPFAARFRANGWETFCATAPALAAVRELGAHTRAALCDRPLPLPPGTRGAAGDVAMTRAGVVLSTSGGIQLFDGHAFRSLPAAPGTWPVAGTSSRAPRLALSTSGSGWAAGAGDRMARVSAAERSPAGEPERVVRPAALTRGTPAAVATAPGGGRVLALTDDGAAVGAGRDWDDADAPSVPLRDVAWRSGDEAWGVDETGALVRFDGEDWNAGPAGDGPRTALRLALGGERYATAGAPSGLASLSFRDEDEGYAVGAGGAIARFDGRRWSGDEAPRGADLLAVAAGREGVVAGGADGTVLERTDDGWAPRADAEALAGGQDVVAAAAAADGTLLLAAGSTLLAREPGADEWTVARIAPLGAEIRELAAVRTPSGELRAIALAGPAEAASLLAGDAHGWRDLAPGGLERVTGFDVDAKSGAVWATGFAGDTAGLARADLDAAPPTAATAPEAAAATAPAPAADLVDDRRVYANPQRPNVRAALEARR
jgi:soluble lytic murein transglycosylase-like protein